MHQYSFFVDDKWVGDGDWLIYKVGNSFRTLPPFGFDLYDGTNVLVFEDGIVLNKPYVYHASKL